MAKPGPKPKSKEEKEAAKKNGDLGVKMDQMISGLNTVGGALEKLIDLQTVGAEKVAPQEETKEKFNPKLDDETYPQDEYIPKNYRKIVDDLLSDEFGIKITDFDDRTDFQFAIIVPEKYSSVTPEDKAKGVEDIRSRMIPRSLGENGVKEWCKLIRQNLNKHYSEEGMQSPFTN